MADLVVKDLIKKYDNNALVVKNVSLSVEAGELVSFLGPSGCGKTTTLRMIAGLLLPDQGSISIRGKDVTNSPAYKRDIGMVFQNYALFPHLTVAENIAFGLRMRRLKRSELQQRVKEALTMVNLSQFGDRYPKSLSGGQQQRVALARALVLKPAVLLLDEPLSALDAKLRQETRDEIRRLQQELGVATVFVTHDQDEALALSDRIAVLNHGVVQQFDEPTSLFEKPVNEFVARFMGIPNVFSAEQVGQNQYRTLDGLLVQSSDTKSDISAIGVRPERIQVRPGTHQNGKNCFSGLVLERSYTGSMVRYVIDINFGNVCTSFVASVPSNSEASRLRKGDQATINWSPEDTLLLLPEEK